jgi:DNA-binding transcriptional ArsR family regulator
VATADLLLHPVRLRIVQAFLGQRALTTAELGAELDDVPTASLYRHVGLLADAGVLTVAEERKVRGAAERRYRLAEEATSADVAGMSAEDHRRAFATFVAALLADFDRYVDAAGPFPDLAADGVGYRQAGLWLDDDELAELLADLRAMVGSRMALPQREGRRRRILSTVLMPGG